ncbi:unnamed protein product [Closterium sp. NIES-53]
MASLRVLAFDHEGRPVQFDTWLDDLQLYLLSDSKDSVSLFDLASGAASAPPATADNSTRSQWLGRDTAARIAIRNHLPLAECAHFGTHRTVQALYNAVVAQYSSPATAALGLLLLPYLFPKLSAFATVEDLVAEVADVMTGVVVRATVEHLLAAETSAVAVGAARGTPRLPFFEGTAAARARVARVVDVEAAVVELAAGVVVGAVVQAVEAVELVAGVGALMAGVGALVEVVEAAVGVAALEAVGLVAVGRALGESVLGGQHQQQQRWSKTPSSQQLREWFLRGASGGSCPYVIRTGDRADLLKSRMAIFDLDFDANLFAMYALSVSAKGDYYRCVPPDPGIAAAALGASESGNLPSTAPAAALHTFTLDSGASRCFFRDSTTLTPLPAPIPVRLADPSGGPVVAHSSTFLHCPAVPSGSLSGLHLPSFSTNLVSTAALQDAMVTTTTPGGQRVSICTCTRTGRHIATFTRRPGSSLYTLATEPSQTLLWHHRLGHPSLPRLHSMHSRLLVSGLPRSLPPLPPSPTPPCLSCVEGRQRAAPHSSSFPPMTAPCRLSTWTFLHSHLAPCLPFQDITFDESVPFYRLFPYRSAPAPPPPLFLAPGPPSVDPLLPKGPAPSCVSQVDPLPSPGPVQVAVNSGAARGAASGGAEPRGAESEGAETGGAQPGDVEIGGAERGGVATRGAELEGVEPWGAEPGGAASEGAESGGAEPQGAALSGGSAGASPRLSLQQLREWFVWLTRLRNGASRAGGAGTAGAGGPGVAAGAGVTGGTATIGPGDVRTRGTGAAGTGGVEGAGAGDLSESSTTATGGAGAGGAGVGSPGAGGAGVGDPGVGGGGAGGAGAVDPGGTVRPRPYFVPLLQQQSSGLSERRGHASPPVSPDRTARRVPCSCPPPVPGMHAMTLRPSSVPLHIPLSAPPKSSLPEVLDPESDRACATSPAVSRLLATAITDPSFESAAVSALVAELLDFAAACRLDYATALVAESESASPPSVGGECALGTDVLEDRHEDFECLAAAVPRFASMLLAPEGYPDALDIPNPRSYAEVITGTYVDEVPPPESNIVDGMWIFRVKRPPGSPPAFKARNVAGGFSQRQGVDYFHTFSSTPKMTTLWVLLHVAAQRDYELHFLDFSTAFLQGSLHEEIWLRRPPGFTESFPAGTQWSFRRPVYGLREAPREWHDTLRTTLVALGFAPATADPSLFLRIDTSLPSFYVLIYVHDLVFATPDTEALTLLNSELKKRHTCTDLGPSALRLLVLLATAHSSVYQPLALSSSFLLCFS